MDSSLPDPSIRGILQARTLEWALIPFSRVSSQPRNQTCISYIADRFFTNWATGKPKCKCNVSVNTLMHKSVTGHHSYVTGCLPVPTGLLLSYRICLLSRFSQGPLLFASSIWSILIFFRFPLPRGDYLLTISMKPLSSWLEVLPSNRAVSHKALWPGVLVKVCMNWNARKLNQT